MKRWFYDHPSITFLFLGAYYLLLVAVTIDFLEDERWGWFAAGVIASIVATGWVKDWWRDRL